MTRDEFAFAEMALRDVADIWRVAWLDVEPAIYQRAGFTFLVLCLHEALQKLSAAGHRIAFTDDVEDGDVTDLVSRMRNAVCHIRSGHNRLDTGWGAFNLVRGRHENAFRIGNATLGNPYEDDVAIYYGEQRIFAVRHLRRARDEGMAALDEVGRREGYRR